MPAKDDAVVSLSPDPLPLTPLPGTLLCPVCKNDTTPPVVNAALVAVGPPIAFDSVSSDSSSSEDDTLSFYHTVGNYADRILIVGAEAEEPASGNCSVTSVTFNGVALTKIDEAIASDSYKQCASLWFLLEPDTGTHDIVITWPQDTDNRSGGGISIYNAAQQGPEASNTKALSGSPSTITTSLTTLTDGAWVIDAVGSGSKGSGFSPLESGQTERYDVTAGSSAGAGSTKYVASAGLTSMGWAQNANRLAHVIAAFAPVAPTPGPEIDGLFKVEFSCSDQCDAKPKVTSAKLNGISVANGQLVKLEEDDDTEVEFEDGILNIEGVSFV